MAGSKNSKRQAAGSDGPEMAAIGVRLLSALLSIPAVVLLWIHPSPVDNMWLYAIAPLVAFIFVVALLTHFGSAGRAAHPGVSALADIFLVAGFVTSSVILAKTVIDRLDGDAYHCQFDSQHGGDLAGCDSAVSDSVRIRWIIGGVFWLGAAALLCITLLMSVLSTLRYKHPQYYSQREDVEIVNGQRVDARGVSHRDDQTRRANVQRTASTETVAAATVQAPRGRTVEVVTTA